MSKGAGRVGSRAEGASLRRTVSRLGLANASYLRTGMRDLSAARRHYAGTSAAQAERLAISLRHPVRVHIEPGANGKPHVILNDGRHRMTAAREAGATHIRATVVEYGPRGGRIRVWTGVVKIC
jgi:hypothetical protein